MHDALCVKVSIVLLCRRFTRIDSKAKVEHHVDSNLKHMYIYNVFEIQTVVRTRSYNFWFELLCNWQFFKLKFSYVKYKTKYKIYHVQVDFMTIFYFTVPVTRAVQQIMSLMFENEKKNPHFNNCTLIISLKIASFHPNTNIYRSHEVNLFLQKLFYCTRSLCWSVVVKKIDVTDFWIWFCFLTQLLKFF